MADECHLRCKAVYSRKNITDAIFFKKMQSRFLKLQLQIHLSCNPNYVMQELNYCGQCATLKQDNKGHKVMQRTSVLHSSLHLSRRRCRILKIYTSWIINNNNKTFSFFLFFLPIAELNRFSPFPPLPYHHCNITSLST